MMKFPMKGDALQRQQAPEDFNRFTHGLERLFAFDAYLPCQRVPPGPQTTYDAVGREIVKRQERRGEETDIACPVVDDAAANLHPRCDSSKGSHGDNSIPHEARFSLPYGLKTPLLSILSIGHSVTDGVFILQVQRYTVHGKLLYLKCAVVSLARRQYPWRRQRQ